MTLRLALRRFGIDPEKETKIIATGENPQRLAALSRNITQFTLLGEPLVEKRRNGFPRPVRYRQIENSVPRKRRCHARENRGERRPLVNRVVRAFTEAIHYIKTNKEDTKALIGKNLKSNDPEGLEQHLAYNAAYPEVPYPSAEGVKTLLDDIAPRTPKPRQPIPRVSSI